MTRPSLRFLSLCLLLAVGLAQPLVAAEDQGLSGKWKLSLLTFNEFPYGIVAISGTAEKPEGEFVAAQRQFGAPTVSELTRDGDNLRLEITSGARKDLFTAVVPKEADKPILGVLRLQNTLHPARLERTTEDAVGAPVGASLSAQAAMIVRDKEMPAADKVAKLKEVIQQNAGAPGLMHSYEALIRTADKADLSSADVKALATEWLALAAPYGAAWTGETRDKLMASIGAQQKYAALKLEFAQDALKELAADASLDRKAELARLVADAAKAAGNADLAKSADIDALKLEKAAAAARLAKAQADLKSLPDSATTEERAALARLVAESATTAGDTEVAKQANETWQKLEAQLDDEYHQKVPPFKPEPFGGRKDAQDNRVVLLELFTGAQCPPCVAADVAFDALVDSYKPTELIGLQYHLHIPGPDPLTNADSEARAKFYGVRGTPSTYFNGETLAAGGGPMANSKKKYDDYVKIIGGDLAGQQPAKIDLKLARSGDTINVTVSAQVKDEDVTSAREAAAKRTAERDTAVAEGGKKDAEDEDKPEPAGAPQLRLRLVLVQEAVRYVGGNRLRFHHHVVRALPGGVEGKELVAGQVENSLVIDLAAVREGLEKYLAAYPEGGRPFPLALPPLELKDLSIVALVQDDADKQVLGAVLAPVPDAK